MKRVVADEDEFYLQQVEFLEREHKKLCKVEEDYRGVVFVIVRGKVTGLFKTYKEVTDLGGNDRFSVFKKFNTRSSALSWYNAIIARPIVYRKNAIVIEIAFRHYDVSQERDYGCAVSMYFSDHDKRNFTKPVNEHFLLCTKANMDGLLFIEALKHIPIGREGGILTNCKRLAYGINYGLWNWPKHDIVSPPPPGVFLECYKACMDRKIAVDWGEKKAYDSCTSKCVALSEHKTSFKKEKRREAKKEALVWMLCAKRLGIIKDIARLIAQKIRTRSHKLDYF